MFIFAFELMCTLPRTKCFALSSAIRGRSSVDYFCILPSKKNLRCLRRQTATGSIEKLASLAPYVFCFHHDTRSLALWTQVGLGILRNLMDLKEGRKEVLDIGAAELATTALKTHPDHEGIRDAAVGLLQPSILLNSSSLVS